MSSYRVRRVIVVMIMSLAIAGILSQVPSSDIVPTPAITLPDSKQLASLDTLAIKGRAPKTGYSRSQFGSGWGSSLGCDTRNQILARDLTTTVIGEDCKVQSGRLNDPYTGQSIVFTRGEQTSDDVQIDHVVALSNAWQTGAQQLTFEQRVALANDPLNLLAVDGAANQQKSDGDAATWLPSNKPFRCQYIERQISVKAKYVLWVTKPEHDAMQRILASCS